MLGVLYALIFVVGIVLGAIIFASVLEIRYYGGEVDLAEEKFYTEDWIYDDPNRNFAFIRIKRGEGNV